MTVRFDDTGTSRNYYSEPVRYNNSNVQHGSRNCYGNYDPSNPECATCTLVEACKEATADKHPVLDFKHMFIHAGLMAVIAFLTDFAHLLLASLLRKLDR